MLQRSLWEVTDLAACARQTVTSQLPVSCRFHLHPPAPRPLRTATTLLSNTPGGILSSCRCKVSKGVQPTDRMGAIFLSKTGCAVVSGLCACEWVCVPSADGPGGPGGRCPQLPPAIRCFAASALRRFARAALDSIHPLCVRDKRITMLASLPTAKKTFELLFPTLLNCPRAQGSGLRRSAALPQVTALSGAGVALYLYSITGPIHSPM